MNTRALPARLLHASHSALFRLLLRPLLLRPLQLAPLLVLAACATDAVGDLKIEFYNLAGAYYELGQYERAAEFYNRALAIDPNLLDASYNLARTHIETGRYQAAEEILQELLSRDNDNLRFQETLAYSHYRRGDRYRALRLYYALLEQSPYRLSAIYNIALIHQERGEPVLALRFMALATDIDADDQEISYRYAELLYNSSETAITGYYSNLGDYYAIVDSLDESYDRALNLYRSLARHDEVEDERLLEIGALFATERFYADALIVYDRLLTDDPHNATAHFQRGALLLTEADEPLEGIAAFERALRNGFDDSTEIERLLATEDLLQRARIEQLLAQYEIEVSIAAGVDPDDPDAPDAPDAPDIPDAADLSALEQFIDPSALPESSPTGQASDSLLPGQPLP